MLPALLLTPVVRAAEAEGPALPAAGAGHRRTLALLSAAPGACDRFDHLILAHSLLRGLDPRLVKAVIAAESEFYPAALSPAGARGLMQLMPATAEELGVGRGELWDPDRNIGAGTAYLRLLFGAAARLHGLEEVRPPHAPAWLVERVVAAYHAGPRVLAGRAWPAATRLYVGKVLLFRSAELSRLRRHVDVAMHERVTRRQ